MKFKNILDYIIDAVLVYVFLILLFALLATSCTMTKNISKHKDTTDSTVVKASSVTSITQEKIDTTVYTKADTTIAELKLNDKDTTSSDSIVYLSNTKDATIEIDYNRITKKINIKDIHKAQAIHVYNNVTKHSNATSVNDVKVNKESDAKELEKHTSTIPWWTWLILVLVILLYLFFRYYLKKI